MDAGTKAPGPSSLFHSTTNEPLRDSEPKSHARRCHKMPVRRLSVLSVSVEHVDGVDGGVGVGVRGGDGDVVEVSVFEGVNVADADFVALLDVEGVREGDAVCEGVFDGVLDGEAVCDGVEDGVGVCDGVLDGVFEGDVGVLVVVPVVEGVWLGVRDGDGV